jgi:hypothetical protein
MRERVGGGDQVVCLRACVYMCVIVCAVYLVSTHLKNVSEDVLVEVRALGYLRESAVGTKSQ